MVMGSKAWAAAARALLLFTPDRENENRQGGLIYTRGNLAAPTAGLRYRLDQKVVRFDKAIPRPSTGELVTEGVVNLFVPEGATGISLDEALGPKDQATSRLESEAFLLARLADREEHLLSELIQAQPPKKKRRSPSGPFTGPARNFGWSYEPRGSGSSEDRGGSSHRSSP